MKARLYQNTPDDFIKRIAVRILTDQNRASNEIYSIVNHPSFTNSKERRQLDDLLQGELNPTKFNKIVKAVKSLIYGIAIKLGVKQSTTEEKGFFTKAHSAIAHEKMTKAQKFLNSFKDRNNDIQR